MLLLNLEYLLLVKDSNIFRFKGLSLVFKVKGLGFRVQVLWAWHTQKNMRQIQIRRLHEAKKKIPSDAQGEKSEEG